MDYVQLFIWLSLIGALVAYFGFNVPSRILYRHLPGVYEEFFWGSLRKFRKIGSFNFYIEYRKKYGDTFIVWFGRTPRIYTSDADLFKKFGSLMNRAISSKPSAQEIKENPGQTNIVMSRKERWQDIRAISQPAFNPQAINEYFPCIVRSTEECIGDIDKAYKEKKEVNILQLSKYLTTMAIMEAAFGLKFSIQKEDDRATITHLSKLTRSILSEGDKSFRRIIFNALSLFPEILDLTKFVGIPRYKIIRVGLKAPIGDYVVDYWKDHGLTDNLKSQEYKSQMDQIQSNGQFNHNAQPLQNFRNWKEHEGSGLYMKLMQKGLVHGEPLDQKQIAGNVQTMVIAGHDTTATTIGMSIYMLSKNKDQELKVLQEIDSFGPLDNFSAKDIEKFPYIEAVVKESLRLYPPAILTSRIVESSNFYIGDQKLPEGGQVLIHIRGLHTNEKYWPRAMEYLPERFLPGSELAQKHPNAFQPFGYGPRICLGWRFAMLEAVTALVTMYKNYTFSIPPSQKDKPIEFNVEVTIVPKTPIELIPEPRVVS